MRIEFFDPGDIEHIDVQDAQANLKPFFPVLAESYSLGDAWTVYEGERIVACAGLIWTDIGAHLWAVVAKNAPLLKLHRTMTRALDTYRDLKITATSECDFMPGCKWLSMLGFEQEPEPIKGFGEDGRDHYVFVRQT